MTTLELPKYVTRMTRCDACGVAFPSSSQVFNRTRKQHSHTEICPSGHVNTCSEVDYYFV